MKLLLDTHMLVWWLERSERLSECEFDTLDALADDAQLGLSVMSVWELELLEARGRIACLPNFEGWIQRLGESGAVSLQPLTVEVILAQRNLPDSFHRDPADRLITCTAQAAGVPLATQDLRIIRAQCVEIWEV